MIVSGTSALCPEVDRLSVDASWLPGEPGLSLLLCVGEVVSKEEEGAGVDMVMSGLKLGSLRMAVNSCESAAELFRRCQLQ
jgi:hypothetical protein